MMNKKGFSVAEAMVTLTIFAVLAASAAPLISKQMKNSAFSDAQASRLGQQIKDLNEVVSKVKPEALWGLASDKVSVYRAGGNVGIGTSSPSAKLDVQNEGNNLLKVNSDGSFEFGYRTVGSNLVKPRFKMNKNSHVQIFASTREETHVNDPENKLRNDTRALSIYWPEDLDGLIECLGHDKNETCTSYQDTPGYSELAFFNSSGSLYINSINNLSNKAAIEVRNGILPRTWIRTDGQLNIRISETAPDQKALVIRDYYSINSAENAWIKRDGSAYFKGNVESAGSASFKSLSVDGKNVATALDNLNNELSDSKKLIAELKSENELLKEQLAMFQQQVEQILVMQNTEKIAQKRVGKVFK